MYHSYDDFHVVKAKDLLEKNQNSFNNTILAKKRFILLNMLPYKIYHIHK